MIINGHALLTLEPIKGMATEKHRKHGVSYGLSEAGYDIRIKQDIKFFPNGTYTYEQLQEKPVKNKLLFERIHNPNRKHRIDGVFGDGVFCIASAIEEFDMPTNLVGIVHDKSTWARRGLSVFNTVIEPGWKGFLTLELVYHGSEPLHIKAGSGIAQVVFHVAIETASYDGKYQNQANEPVKAISDA